MRRIARRAFALLCALTAAVALDSAAGAQTLQIPSVPPRRVTDARGVDLVSGQLLVNLPLVSFGEHATGLRAWVEVSPGSSSAPVGAFLNSAGGMMGGALRPQAYIMGSDGAEDQFGPYENIIFPDSAGFAQQIGQNPWYNVDGSWSYHVNADGSRYSRSFGTAHMTRFESSDPNLAGFFDAAGTRGVIDPASPYLNLFQTITRPNGEQWRFFRQYVTVPCPNPCQTPTVTISRIRFITSSRGYGIQFLYLTDTTPASSAAAGTWNAPRRVTAYNKSAVYCNESLLQECSSLAALPYAEIAYNATAATITIREPSATDGVELGMTQSNGIWSVPLTMRHTAVPNSTVTVELATDNDANYTYVSRVTDADGQWNYSRTTYVDDSGHVPLMHATSTNPAGGQVEIFGYGVFGSIQWSSDELGRYYAYGDGFPFRDWGRTEPGGDDTTVNRDERNNIVSIVRTPAPNTGLQPVTVYSAAYPLYCTNPRTCNRPTSATDANGNVTDYTYAPEHGGVLTETGPAVPTPQANGSIVNVRPQRRYEYAQRTAWVANGSGGYVAMSPIWLPVRERHCRTTAASGSTCAGGAADEVVTDYDYGPNSGPNNLLLRGVSVTAHDGTGIVTLRTCYGYDAMGNRISETRPNANLSSCP